MTGSREDGRLKWQSKLILLLVVPWTVTSVAIESLFWVQHAPVVVWQALGISVAFGLLVWRLRAATVGGALTGAAITASLMLATAGYPYEWAWLHGGLMPLLAVFVLTYVATKIGRAKKERLGTAESKRGRNAAQVAANLGIAALISNLVDAQPFFGKAYHSPSYSLMLATIPLAEAAADTVSSEIGQVFGGQPRMITTMRKVKAGTDGGITFAGTISGVIAAFAVGLVAYRTANLSWIQIEIITAGAVFGLLFDSLLGAIPERHGWLNNDMVNFLSTLSAPVFIAVTYTLLAIWAFGAEIRFH
jgi:uncharacterized protein (TIGR00297 family)